MYNMNIKERINHNNYLILIIQNKKVEKESEKLTIFAM